MNLTPKETLTPTPTNYKQATSGIAYLDSAGTLPPLLCLHGIQGSKESYSFLLDSPLARQARLVIPDIPGFGASHTPADCVFDLARQAERLVDFIDDIKIERIAVYGHSLGGMLGTLLLEKIPDRITGLISSEGNLSLEDCGESRRVVEIDFDEFEATRYPELKKRGVSTSALSFYSIAKSVVKLSESERLFTVLANSPRPVLFIRGGASHFKSVPVGNNVRNVEIPNETHFTLPGSRGSVEIVTSFFSELCG
jgi:pimeloyl-ACP methyl ester carboxylesterase